MAQLRGDIICGYLNKKLFIMKLTWLTDIHLNCLKYPARFAFYQQIINTSADAVLITGDIAEGTNVIALLREMRNQIKKPIYFVLGNHDYYGKSIVELQQEMVAMTEENNRLFWMPVANHQLNSTTILIGQDSWADGRLGDFYNSTASFYDSRMIPDLIEQKNAGKSELLKKMQQLADQDALQMQKQLLAALDSHPETIIIMTHVPPFQEVALHKNKICDNNYLPLFVSKIMGDTLLPIITANPQIKFLLLCGHTHSAAVYQPLDNLTVKAGKAEYNKPVIQEIFEV